MEWIKGYKCGCYKTTRDCVQGLKRTTDRQRYRAGMNEGKRLKKCIIKDLTTRIKRIFKEEV